jgi:hypothetical protein
VLKRHSVGERESELGAGFTSFFPRQKVREFCRPTLQSFPTFLVAAKKALLRSRPSPNPDTVAKHVYGTRNNMGEERCCSAIPHQI